MITYPPPLFSDHDTARLADLAREIAQRLLEGTACSTGGGPAWGRGFTRDQRPTDIAGAFNGRIGEALFFAALDRTLGEGGDVAASIGKEYVRHALVDPGGFVAAMWRGAGPGLLGLGSVLYALPMVSGTSGEQAAADLALAVRPEAIASETQFDFTHGLSGLLSGLIALYEWTGRTAVLEPARWCADRLLDLSSVDGEGARSWGSTSGFAHGTSGPVHALGRASQAVGEDIYLTAALEGAAFERRLRGGRGWRRTMHDGEESVAFTWCEGAPGIGLSRLACLRGLPDSHREAIAEDLAVALRATQSALVAPIDNLCCGNLGRLDVAIEYGLNLDGQALVDWARAFTLALADERDGSYLLPPRDPAYPHRAGGLWQGETGIGYALLRAYAPERNPSVLHFSTRLAPDA